MRKPIVYVCDVCGVEKKEANHWFIVMWSLITELDCRHFKVYPWAMVQREHADAIHICGQECLGKKVAEMSEALSR